MAVPARNQPPRYNLADLIPVGADVTEPDRQRIRSALAEALVSVAPAEPAALIGAEAVRILAETGRRLTRERPRWAAVLGLAESAPPALRDRLPLRLMWLRALPRAGRHDEVMPEITRLLLLDPPDEKRDSALVQMATQMGLAVKLPSLPRLYDLLWGPPQMTMQAALSVPQLIRHHVDLPRALIGFVGALRGDGPERAASLSEDIAWSLGAAHFSKFILDAESFIARRGALPLAQNAAERAVMALAEQARNVMAQSDFSVLHRLRDQGRSIILLGSHLGLLEPLRLDFFLPGMVTAVVHSGNLNLTGRPGPPFRHDMIEVATRNNPNLPFDLLKLAKRQRREPVLTRIFPDGAHSDTRREIDLGGQPVSIGTGAAVLGYFGRAHLVFAKSRWTGQGWMVDLTMGPDLALAGSLDEATDLLAEFYAERLIAALNGPARDIGGHGGTLAQLRAALG